MKDIYCKKKLSTVKEKKKENMSNLVVSTVAADDLA